MGKVFFYVKNGTNEILKVETTTDVIDSLPKGTNLQVWMRQQGFVEQYLGNYSSSNTPSTAPPTMPPTQPPTEPPTQPPTQPPTGSLLYDSNVNIDWAALNGQVLRVDDHYGSIAGNGKGFHMNASGNPRMYLDPATKELKLEHDGSYGRAYFCVTNYNSRLECEFMLDSMSHNFSIKTRNRHQIREEGGQPNAMDQQRQGGIGSSYHEDTVEQQVEVWHGNNTLSGSKSLSPKLVANKWYKMTYTVQDVNGKVRQTNTLDGVTVFQRDISPPSQFFNKAEFDTWSEFWLRLNASNGGWVKIRNIKMFSV